MVEELNRQRESGTFRTSVWLFNWGQEDARTPCVDESQCPNCFCSEVVWLCMTSIWKTVVHGGMQRRRRQRYSHPIRAIHYSAPEQKAGRAEKEGNHTETKMKGLRDGQKDRQQDTRTRGWLHKVWRILFFANLPFKTDWRPVKATQRQDRDDRLVGKEHLEERQQEGRSSVVQSDGTACSLITSKMHLFVTDLVFMVFILPTLPTHGLMYCYKQYKYKNLACQDNQQIRYIQ